MQFNIEKSSSKKKMPIESKRILKLVISQILHIKMIVFPIKNGKREASFFCFSS
jgi:hypothetical protein